MKKSRLNYLFILLLFPGTIIFSQEKEYNFPDQLEYQKARIQTYNSRILKSPSIKIMEDFNSRTIKIN